MSRPGRCSPRSGGGSSTALLAVGVTGSPTPTRRAPLPIDAAAGTGPAGGAEPRARHPAGGRRSVQRCLDADGRRGGVRRGTRRRPRDSKNVAAAVNQFVATRRARAGAGRGAGRGGAPARGRRPRPRRRTRAGRAAEAAPASRRRRLPGPRAGTGPCTRSPRPRRPGSAAAPDPAATRRCRPRPTPAAPGVRPRMRPVTQDFMYPSISNGCLADGGNVLATAISVAGPAKIPAPGPAPARPPTCSPRSARPVPRPSRSCR